MKETHRLLGLKINYNKIALYIMEYYKLYAIVTRDIRGRVMYFAITSPDVSCHDIMRFQSCLKVQRLQKNTR